MKVKMKLIKGLDPDFSWKVKLLGFNVTCACYTLNNTFFFKITKVKNKKKDVQLYQIDKLQYNRYKNNYYNRSDNKELLDKASFWHDKAIHENNSNLATFYGNVARGYLNKINEV